MNMRDDVIRQTRWIALWVIALPTLCLLAIAFAYVIEGM